MMIRQEKVGMICAELKEADVRVALIDAAKSYINGDFDDRFAPQLISDGYGGFTIYFRKAEPNVAKATYRRPDD